MKNDLCELIVIVDKSGSMYNVINDTIGGFNTFLDVHQKLQGEAKLTLVLFDTTYKVVHNGLDIQKVPKLDNSSYDTGGMTALLDAVGKTIDEVGKRLSETSEEERPQKVIFMIITDGEENSSKEYDLQQIKEKTKHQQDVYKWDFIFMGANQDAWSNARDLGLSNAINYKDARKTWSGMTHYSSSFRISDPTMKWSPIKEADKSFNKTQEELNKELEDLKNNNKT